MQPARALRDEVIVRQDVSKIYHVLSLVIEETLWRQGPILTDGIAMLFKWAHENSQVPTGSVGFLLHDFL